MDSCWPGWASFVFGIVLVSASPAFAQFGGSGAGQTGIGGAAQRNLNAAQAASRGKGVSAPPVLPGMKPASDPAAPTVLPSDMSPTDALFDAINRGDLPAAREAVNRGANLDGQNMLGLTPLELSVDLGRNDLSFMLLSMRGEDAASRRLASGETATAPDDRRVQARRLVSRTRTVTVTSRAAEEPVVATPRLDPGNGGAPIPAAGFLGFDEGRSIR